MTHAQLATSSNRHRKRERAEEVKEPVLAVDTQAAATKAVSAAFELPVPWFPASPGSEKMLCRARAATSGRSFGPFEEKTLVCNSAAKMAIDSVCEEGGFTQSWEGDVNEDGDHTMRKIPAVVLIKLLKGLPEESADVLEAVSGAYAISMDPNQRTCMNVFVGRRPDGSGGYTLDKFSLYYPDNHTPAAQAWGRQWPLLQGFSFRTAVFQGTFKEKRAAMARLGLHKHSDLAEHGLVVDGDSLYEDCAYAQHGQDESDTRRRDRIDGIVSAMVGKYGGDEGMLALSYDPDEEAQGTTALESEWELLKRHL